MVQENLKLNLGCGADLRKGYLNVDFAAPRSYEHFKDNGYDLEFMAYDLETTPWPWVEGEVDEILALNVLEHINRFDAVWHEIHRILKPGGRIKIEVVYKNTYDPFHHSLWNKESIRYLTNGYATKASPDHAFRRVDGPHFRHIPSGFPWWHAQVYLGITLPPIPGTKLHMSFTLEKT